MITNSRLKKRLKEDCRIFYSILQHHCYYSNEYIFLEIYLRSRECAPIHGFTLNACQGWDCPGHEKGTGNSDQVSNSEQPSLPRRAQSSARSWGAAVWDVGGLASGRIWVSQPVYHDRLFSSLIIIRSLCTKLWNNKHCMWRVLLVML